MTRKPSANRKADVRWPENGSGCPLCGGETSDVWVRAVAGGNEIADECLECGASLCYFNPSTSAYGGPWMEAENPD